ncbi:MAG: DUF4838 domain-containing protein, partial [Victivallales bacterium]|nr:DUF4838 domain-containing protein [Victivallales bacterium]
TSRTLNLVCANVTSNMRDTWDWMARNGMKPQVQAYLRNPYLKKIPVDFQGGGHCFAGLLPSKKYFKKHPEYFALVNGKRIPQVNEKGRFKSQPCTSNPNTIRIMAEHLDAFLNKYPDVNLYVIGNNDVPIWCECDNCQALDSAEDKETHGVATRYWILVNELINRVAPKHPNVTFVGAPYQNFQYPSNEVKPDSQAEVEFCVHQKCYQHPMSDEGCRVNERYRKLLKAWSGLSKGVKTYEYTDCLPGGDVIYLPLSKNIADDLKYYYKLGVRGYKTEVAPPDGVFGKVWQNRRTKEMWPAIWPAIYTMAYFEWNVDADYGEFLEDMGSKAYGAAWPVMRKYVSELTNAMVNSPGHMIYGTPDVVLGKCLDRPNQGEKLNSLLEKALKAVADDPARLARVKMDKDY